MTTAVYESVMQNIASRIQGLSLTDLTSDRLHVESVGTYEGKKLPFISVFLGDPERIPNGEGNNLQDRIHYSVFVAMVASKESEATMRPKLLLWREQILDEFHLKTMPVTSIEYTESIPKAVMDRGAWFGKGLMISGLEIQAHRLRARP